MSSCETEQTTLKKKSLQRKEKGGKTPEEEMDKAQKETKKGNPCSATGTGEDSGSVPSPTFVCDVCRARKEKDGGELHGEDTR